MDNEDLHWENTYNIIQKALYSVDTTFNVLSIQNYLVLGKEIV